MTRRLVEEPLLSQADEVVDGAGRLAVVEAEADHATAGDHRGLDRSWRGGDATGPRRIDLLAGRCGGGRVLAIGAERRRRLERWQRLIDQRRFRRVRQPRARAIGIEVRGEADEETREDDGGDDGEHREHRDDVADHQTGDRKAVTALVVLPDLRQGHVAEHDAQGEEQERTDQRRDGQTVGLRRLWVGRVGRVRRVGRL